MKKKILDVPKIKQTELCYCGPASLSMVLAYYGIHISQEKIAKEVSRFRPKYYSCYPIAQYGIVTWDKVRYARTKGFIAHQYENSSLEKLISLINQDIPPLVRIESIPYRRGAHSSVVKGYDLEKKMLYFNDPNDKRRNKLDFEYFKKIWLVKNKSYGNSINSMASIKPK